MHEIGRELDQIGEARALRGKRRADIGEHQAALRVEIGRRLAVLVGADLAGDEQKLRRLNARELRILPERLAEAVGVENLNIGHCCFPYVFFISEVVPSLLRFPLRLFYIFEFQIAQSRIAEPRAPPCAGAAPSHL